MKALARRRFTLAPAVPVVSGAAMLQAIEILAARKISELPVVDDGHRPVGLIDITDVVGLLPHDASGNAEPESPAWNEQPARSHRGVTPPTLPFRTKP